MSFFHELVAQDNEVLLNVDEFGEYRTVIYDGVKYPHIKILLTGARESKRTQYTGDFAQGLYLAHTKMHCLIKDVGNKQPEKGTNIRISTTEAATFYREYRIAESILDFGMLNLRLEAIDE